MIARTLIGTMAATLVAVLLPAVPATAAACAPPSGQPLADASFPPGEIVFRGHGFGHGLGMGQWGAEGAGRLGCGHRTILQTYYRNVAVGTPAATGNPSGLVPRVVHVALAPSGPDSPAPTTFRVTSGDRRVTWTIGARTIHQPPGRTWRVVAGDGRVQLRDAADRVAAHPPAGRAMSARTGGSRVVLPEKGRGYRHGTLRFVPRGTRMHVTLAVGLENYLLGLGEMPDWFTVAALRAQAVAARTYAAWRANRGIRSACDCHLYDSIWDQVYAGTDGITERWHDQVRATRSEVIWHSGAPIAANYASSHGGISESDGRSYLHVVNDARWTRATRTQPPDPRMIPTARWRADPDRYADPSRSWSAAFAADDVRGRLGLGDIGRLRTVRVLTRSPSGRASSVEFGGTTGSRALSGTTVRRGLGLRSELFEVRSRVAEAPVPLTGDWDRDGRAEPGWYHRGRFVLGEPGDQVSFSYGPVGAIPVVGDWDGDGRDTVGVIFNGKWWLRNVLRGGASDHVFAFGRPGQQDIPVTGDWDANGRDTVGVVRAGRWLLRNAHRGGPHHIAYRFGRVGDTPVPGDFDGDGRDTPGVVRGNRWLLRDLHGSGPAHRSFTFGRASDVPVTGDFGGIGRDGIGVERNGTWYLRNRALGGVADRVVRFPPPG